MSFFAVTLRKIAKVWNHPNADRLDLAQVDNSMYQFVVGRDQYKIGDEVLYFPIDAVLPAPAVEKLGLVGKLSGKDKNRIKTVKLRGEISQGIVCKTALFESSEADMPSLRELSPELLTARLGVTKYEPPEIFSKGGNLVHMPGDIPVYDIEGADSNPDVVEALMDQKVYITEKMEGTNFWISAVPVGDTAPWEDPIIGVFFGTRHYQVNPIPEAEHEFWRVAKKQKLDAFVTELAQQFPGRRVTARGEYVGPGVQGNIYKFPDNRIYIFDLLIDGRYVPAKEFIDTCFEANSRPEFAVLTPPMLCSDITLREWLNERTLRVASNGKSSLADTLREGIVIKPLIEADHPKIGRLMIKQRDPVYLEKEKD